jgi:hypothetical protein
LLAIAALPLAAQPDRRTTPPRNLRTEIISTDAIACESCA